MERAVRVAESAGALIAGPLAHRDLQPVTRDTPIRAGLPPPQRTAPAPRGRATAR